MLDIYSSNESSSEMDYKDKNNELFQDNISLNSIGHYGYGNKNSSSHQANNSSSMVDFDMLQSSLFLLPSGQDQFFVTSAINWEPASTKNISTKVK